MKTYYDILGVSNSANADEIKTAYRKLAREHHPDKGGDKETFQQIQEAYENLIDPNKRHQYDNKDKNIHHDFFTNFSFMNMNNNKSRRNDHIYNCSITLRDVFYGLTKKIRVNRTSYCKKCNIFCNVCNGNGRITQKIHLGMFAQIIEHQCPECNGSGKNKNQTLCNICNNKRTTTEEKIFEINIPKGVENGETFVFENWGEQATNPNEISGNLVVKISIEKHPFFIREGNDLILNHNITFTESIIGKTIIIKNFDNDHEINTIGFGIINPFKEYTLIGKGMMTKTSNRGNLKIRFTIQYPDKTLTHDDINDLKNVFNKINI